MEATIEVIKSAIARMNELKLSEGFIVETRAHIRVSGEGLNKTGFTVKCPQSCCNAIVYANEEEAQNKGYNYYLIDGRGKPLYMITTKSSTFFEKSIQEAEEILSILNANI